jgi:Xaa-Pro aminopeptidase
MSAFAQRTDRLVPLVEERDADLLLVTNLPNVRYLTGFTGTNAAVLVGSDRRTFVTDFRYVERAEREITDFDVVRGRDDLLKTVADLAQEWGVKRVGFEDWHMTVRAHAKLAEHVPDAAELVPASGLVERLRAVKDDAEIAAIRQAAELADEVYRWLVSDHGLVGHTEREVAVAMELRSRELGADGVSFPPIVAAAENGALPHAEPRADPPIPRDTLVVVDYGVIGASYCSDCTRTFATGDIDSEAAECYELVRLAQEAALAAVRAGADERAVDAVARALIADAGRAEQFGHGLGHGVGLEVHEAPRLAPSADGALETGNVVTVEPGVYVPGRFGVRIEDLVVVGATGPEILTSIPKELTVV